MDIVYNLIMLGCYFGQTYLASVVFVFPIHTFKAHDPHRKKMQYFT